MASFYLYLFSIFENKENLVFKLIHKELIVKHCENIFRVESKTDRNISEIAKSEAEGQCYNYLNYSDYYVAQLQSR